MAEPEGSTARGRHAHPPGPDDVQVPEWPSTWVGWILFAGVIVAVLSILVNIAFLAAYPIWSTIMIAVDILVIWALTVHGHEMRVMREQS